MAIMDERDGHKCDHCGESLAQLGGEWYCPECDDEPGESFTLDGDDEDVDFAL